MKFGKQGQISCLGTKENQLQQIPVHHWHIR